MRTERPDHIDTGLCRDLREEAEAIDATPPPLDDLLPGQYAWMEAMAALLADEYGRRWDRATQFQELFIEIKCLSRSPSLSPEDRRKYRREAKRLWKVYFMMEHAVSTAERWRTDLWDRAKVLLPNVAKDMQVVRAETGQFERDRLDDARKEWGLIEVAAAEKRAFAGKPKWDLAPRGWDAAERAVWRRRPENADMPTPAPAQDLREEIAQFLSLLGRLGAIAEYLADGSCELRPLANRLAGMSHGTKKLKEELKASARGLAAEMERHGIDSTPVHRFVQDWGSDAEVRALLSRLAVKALGLRAPNGLPAMPAVGPTPAGQQAPAAQAAPADDLITSEVAISEYHTSRATIRRKIKGGKLCDHRPPSGPANAKLLLSRAELDRFFVRKK